MMLSNKWPIIIIVLGTILLVISEALKPKPLDLRPTLSNEDKIPYGNFLIYDLLPGLFPEEEIEISNRSFYDFYLNDSLQQKNYICINYLTADGRNFTSYDVEQLLNFVANGNTVFYSSQTFPKTLSDTLNIELGNSNFDRLALNNNPFEVEDSQKVVSKVTSESYFFKPAHMYKYFEAFDSTNTTVLASKNSETDNMEQPILINIKYGNGNMVLNTTPFIFSNFNMLNNQHNFIAEALSNLPVKPTIWDEYYKPYALEQAGTSPLRYILSQKALKWALYLTLISLLIFVIFLGKRLQRVIPVIQPPQNISINFAKSLAMLYYHKKDHIEIAKKRIEYFKAFVKNNYSVDILEANQNDISKITNLTNLKTKKVEDLFKNIKQAVVTNSFNNSDLIQLNRNIDEFYKNA